jgi:hypothetical protein
VLVQRAVEDFPHLSGFFGLLRLSRLAPDRPEGRGDNEIAQKICFTDVEGVLQLFMMKRAEGYLGGKPAEPFILFKRGDRLRSLGMPGFESFHLVAGI